jgi:hypothetical protein
MRKKLVGIGGIILGLAVSVFAQGTIDKNGVYHPTDEELSQSKRDYELLQHPTFITMRLSSGFSDPRSSTTPPPYTVDQWLHFELFITQNSSESVTIWNYLWPYREYRPELNRDGDILHYTKQAQEYVDRAEREPPEGSMSASTYIPGREYPRADIRLEEWYESPFQPGHYQLTVRKRFTPKGDWVESNPVTFDVIPRKDPTPIPDGVGLRLVPDTSKPSPDGHYRLGYDECVAVELINDSDQRVQVSVIDRYYGHRPQLIKDGKLIPYSDETAKLIEAKDKDPRLVEVTPNLVLDPKTNSRLDGFSLKQWYGPLAPGVYHLTDRRRFEIGGPWTKDSAELVFEVVP